MLASDADAQMCIQYMVRLAHDGSFDKVSADYESSCMSPYDIDPNINYPRLHQLSDELTQFLTLIHALYLDAVAGFAFIHSRVLADQEEVRRLVKGSELDSEAFQDSRMFSYTQIFAEDFCASDFHQATQGEVKTRNSPGGSNYTTLGQLCLVALYDYWNDHLRREYVVAKGRLDANEQAPELIQQQLREHASHDLWGDLGTLRNAIVHNHGIATSKVARCKLICWFQRGDLIDISPSRMNAILLGVSLFRNQLFDEGFPKHSIEIPLHQVFGAASEEGVSRC